MDKLRFFYTFIRRACSLLFIFLIFFKASASTYYVSAQGNDASNGTSPSTPWLSIAKVNATAFKPGDAILFNRGETFYGTITVSRSGSPGNFIMYGAYGSGALPIITGFTTISDWKSDGGGIYEYTCPTCQPNLNMVTFQDTLQPMGRWPKLTAANEGFLSVDSHVGSTSITSTGLIGSLNYIGGEIVSRKYRWILDRARILTQGFDTMSCGQLPYLFAGTFYDFFDTHGFFIQNHVNTCTKLGEWAYDSTSKKIKMYFGGNSPSGYTIQASTIDYLVSISNKSYIIFDNIYFKGSNSRTFNLDFTKWVQIKNCDIKFSGNHGVYSTDGNTNNITLNNDSISYTNNNGITTNNGYSWTVTNCYFYNTGTVRGAGMSGDGAYEGLSYINGLVQNNVVRNTGYLGIHFQGDSAVIRNNLVDSFGLVKTDCGGIYCYGETTKHGRKVIGNIVINGLGDQYGVGSGAGDKFGDNGIYMDGLTSNVTIDSNTVYNCDLFAFQLNGVTNIEMSYNTDFNCGEGAPSNGGAGAEVRYSDSPVMPSVLNVKHNISVAKDSAQAVLFFTIQGHAPSAVPGMGILDSNYYCRPIWEPSGIDTVGYKSHIWNDGGVVNTFDKVFPQLFKSLDKWQTYSGQDAHTHKSPKTIRDTRDIKFEYNASSTNKTVSLGANYIDVLGKSYSGTITLAPYSSAVLIKSGPITNRPKKQMPALVK